MNSKPITKILQRAGLAVCVALSPVLLSASALIVQQSDADASSHREAPLISKDQFADNTDVYAFISPENPDNIVLIGSWIPFEAPEGGPNYFEWDDNVIYDINIDNDGDAKADFTYSLTSKTSTANPNTFLYNTGPIGKDGANWSRPQTISVVEKSESGNTPLVTDVLAAPVNIGSKSTPNYDAFDDAFIRTVNKGGDKIKLFAGQVDDAFWVDLQVFDLLTLRGQQPPIGYSNGPNKPVDSVAGFNNHSMVIEVPVSRLTKGDDPVLGVWATASRPSMRVLNGAAGLGSQTHSGDAVQVSRLGMPLTNEVVLPYALKDAFNAIDPTVDATLYTGGAGADIQALLQNSVEDPEVGNLLCNLYGVPLPGDSNGDCQTEFTTGELRTGRGDIFDIFLTGMTTANEFTIQTKNGPVTLPAGFNVNRPANVVPADMLRVNTAIKGDLCSPTPSRLGLLAGDACGFPNGRRLFDDVVEIEVLAVAGAAYQALDGRDADFAFNPALLGVLTDGVDYNDKPFRQTFPYMATAHSGQAHVHTNARKQTVAINNKIKQANVKTSYDATPAANAPAGVFTIEATFKNRSNTNLDTIAFQIAKLTGGNVVLNAQGGPAGEGGFVGALLSAYSPAGVVKPSDTFKAIFKVGLAKQQPFNLRVNGFGLTGDGRGSVVAASVDDAPADAGIVWEIAETDMVTDEMNWDLTPEETVTGVQESVVFLPAVQR